MLTPMKAIRAKCYDCGFDECATGSKNAQIEACTDTLCPLHEHRPVTTALKNKRQAERIAMMSSEERKKYDIRVESARVRFSKR